MTPMPRREILKLEREDAEGKVRNLPLDRDSLEMIFKEMEATATPGTCKLCGKEAPCITLSGVSDSTKGSEIRVCVDCMRGHNRKRTTEELN